MLNKSIYLLTEYQIFEYPIDKDTINQIVADSNLKLVTLKKPLFDRFIDDEILTPKTQNNAFRENIIHEIGHVYCHCGNSLMKNKIIVNKQEKQAEAFAAYFLMPVYVFEEAMKYCNNDFELAEEFGVTVKFVHYRKKHTEAIIKDGYFDEPLEQINFD
ncbi:MAG: ImmA/IrrE family metallo-endopeptidase [Tissierellia bacterium]|nr:ImmA/IrrE family metallo-endopeptidase [Tissierellia bacterium]